MSFYEFKCEKCGKDLEVNCRMSNIGQITNNKTGSLLTPCECGGELKRQYGNIGLGPHIYKNDPSSNQYWKKGKTNGEIANILNDSTANPY